MSAQHGRRASGVERVGLFVDGANLYHATRSLGFEVDFAAMLRFFGSSTYLVRACYYTALIETEDYSPLRPLTDWLAYNGWRVVTKPAKEQADPTGRRRIKGNMDIELAVDMMELAPHLDHAVLVSGDGDFRRVVEAVQRQGVKVTVVSTMESQPPMIADELRRQADGFLELADIGQEIARRGPEQRARPVPPPPTNGARASRITPADPYGEAPEIEPE